VQGFEVDFFSRIYNSYYGFTAPPGFFTEAYINFGLIGVFAISAVWGVLLTSIDSSRLWLRDEGFFPGFKAAAVALLAGTSFAGVGLLIGGAMLTGYVVLVYRLSARSSRVVPLSAPRTT
jgi:hypothetical protein